MRKHEEQFVRLLRYGINGTILNKYDDVNQWDKIYEEAVAHNVEALVYSAINKDIINNTIEIGLLDKWKQRTIMTGITQKQHIFNLCKLFEEFNKESIEVVVLKGAIIRDLYPIPYYRTMGDADILVKEDDMERIHEVLIKNGYMKEQHENEIHKSYRLKNGLAIEIHNKLNHDKHFNGKSKNFEQAIWQNLRKYKINDTSVVTMDIDSLFMHLNIHLAKHCMDRGFGIRQVCDIALYIKQNSKLINWEKFIEESTSFGTLKFSITIIALCNKIFDTEIPLELSDNVSKIPDSLIYMLLEEIISNGVHGKRKDATETMHLSSKYYIDKGSKNTIKIYLNSLFPSSKVLKKQYEYLENTPILLPIAWMQNSYRRLFSKERSISSKLTYVFKGIFNIRKHNKILDLLDLNW